MSTLKDPRALVFDAETQLWNVHAVVRLVSEVCHAAMNSGKREISLWTDDAERKLSDAPGVFACALDSAVEGLELLYLLLDELEALLREEPRQAPGGQGDQGGDREACSHNPEETSA